MAHIRACNILVFALLAGGLAGCGSKQPVGSAVADACPKVAIVDELSTLSRYRPGAGRDPTDVVFEAELVGVKGNCATTRERTLIDMELRIDVVRGPAASGRVAEFEYFVAVADGEDLILVKETFNTRIEFEGNRTRAVNVEELEQLIPLKAGARASEFKVWVGFQLRPEERVSTRTR
jgi:hypothetical protein